MTIEITEDDTEMEEIIQVSREIAQVLRRRKATTIVGMTAMSGLMIWKVSEAFEDDPRKAASFIAGTLREMANDPNLLNRLVE